jgi:hypothetical protein
MWYTLKDFHPLWFANKLSIIPSNHVQLKQEKNDLIYIFGVLNGIFWGGFFLYNYFSISKQTSP